MNCIGHLTCKRCIFGDNSSQRMLDLFQMHLGNRIKNRLARLLRVYQDARWCARFFSEGRFSWVFPFQFHNFCFTILLMEEILHHLGCIKAIKACKYWDIYHINWCRISSINSTFVTSPFNYLWFSHPIGNHPTKQTDDRQGAFL